jgi:hypothetical protein
MLEYLTRSGFPEAQRQREGWRFEQPTGEPGVGSKARRDVSSAGEDVGHGEVSLVAFFDG